MNTPICDIIRENINWNDCKIKNSEYILKQIETIEQQSLENLLEEMPKKINKKGREYFIKIERHHTCSKWCACYEEKYHRGNWIQTFGKTATEALLKLREKLTCDNQK